MKKKETILLLISFLLIFLFVYTALSKWFSFADFTRSMKNQPFNKRYLPLLLYGVPSLELLAVVFLMVNKTKIIGLWLSLFLMLNFTGYIVLIKLNYYGRIPCSCGGVIKSLSWNQHLIFNVFFLALSAIGIATYYNKRLVFWHHRQKVSL